MATRDRSTAPLSLPTMDTFPEHMLKAMLALDNDVFYKFNRLAHVIRISMLTDPNMTYEELLRKRTGVLEVLDKTPAYISLYFIKRVSDYPDVWHAYILEFNDMLLALVQKHYFA